MAEGIAVAVVVGIAIAAILDDLTLRGQNRRQGKLIADLHNRLAARTYGEYATFQSTALQEVPFDSGRRLVYDDTGLLEAEIVSTD